MHRLQVSFSDAEIEFLKERSRRDGTSIAEVIRQIVRREVDAQQTEFDLQSIWNIAGIATDNEPLLNHTPVSKCPELYLMELIRPTQDT